MSFLFGSPHAAAPQASVAPRFTGVRIQTSVYGLPIALVYGQTRVPGNLIWYGDFVAIPHVTTTPSGGGGGGGGKGGGGGGSSTTTTSYTYQTALAIGLCVGPIGSVLQIWNGKALGTMGGLGFTFFPGPTPQTPWGFLTTNHPGQDLPYAGLAYVANPAFDLGTSDALPNFNFEIAALAQNVPGKVDADPKDVFVDYLTNAIYGAGFPSSRLGSLATFSNYCRAAGLLISPVFNEQQPAMQHWQAILDAVNCAPVWSSGLLTVVPYGDQNLSGNGATYTAPSAPLFDLRDDDFLAPQSETDDPITATRVRPADAVNMLRFEYLDRANQYNPAIAEYKDDALIASQGTIPASPVKAHFFCDAGVARTAVQLVGQRKSNVRNQYTFALGWKYILLDPMDIVSITDAALGLDKQWVRVLEITEDADGALAFVVEEYLAGTGAAATYAFQKAAGFSVDYNVAPGNVNTPIVFEPPGPLVQALDIFVAASGANPNWGGAEVWASTDSVVYKRVGTITTPSRMGVLSAALPAGAAVDTTDTLAVDLSQSRGTLLSGTQDDAKHLVTLCYVDGEWLAYQTAQLTALNKYNLTYLVRGAYGSPIGAHLQGAAFTRVDQNIVQFPFSANQIGKPLFLKFLSFNIYGGGLQGLADVPNYTYYPTGLAFRALPADVVNLTSNYLAGLTQLFWDAVPDFRVLDYEVRLGTDWNTSTVIGRTPLTRFTPYIGGSYLVSAHYRTPNGDDVYSAHATAIVVVAGALTQNIIATRDEAATGWPGTLSGSAVHVGSLIELMGAGNLLAESNLLADADILWLGGVGSPGYYQIPVADRVNVGRPVACSVLITTQGQGVNIYAPNMLSTPDLLSLADLLNAASGSSSGAQIQVRVAQADGVYGAWQNYLPGAYTGQYFDARVVLTSNDPQVTAQLTGFTFSVDVPDREDSGVNAAIAAGGTTITYSSPFNGGPGVSAVPLVHVTIMNASAGDDIIVTTSTLSGFTCQIKNGGVGVARSVNWSADGY